MNKTDQSSVQQRCLKENCGKLFVKLLQLAAMKSKTIEDNARAHIQDLINAKISVEDFANRIGVLLSTNFHKNVFENLKTGLPLLRLALFRRELSIEGVNPPPSLAWGLTVQTTQQQQTVLKRAVQPTIAKVIYLPPKMKLEAVTTMPSEDVKMLTTTTNTPLVRATQLSFPKPMAAAPEPKKLKLDGMPAASMMQPSEAFTFESEFASESSNDVLAMCGISVDAERNFGNELSTCEYRFCPPETSFLHLTALRSRFNLALQRHGLEDIGLGVAELIAAACKEYVKGIVEKLVLISEHRTESLKTDPRYEPSRNVRGQLKFLEDVDKAEQKRHKEIEREILMRACNLKKKTDNPELARMRAKAQELQRTEMEEMRQRDADMTALYAIGPRKKLKLECESNDQKVEGNSLNVAGQAMPIMTPITRYKRLNLQDILFFMEQDPQLCRSQLLYKAYLK